MSGPIVNPPQNTEHAPVAYGDTSCTLQTYPRAAGIFCRADSLLKLEGVPSQAYTVSPPDTKNTPVSRITAEFDQSPT